jgi:hypothetical protein
METWQASFLRAGVLPEYKKPEEEGTPLLLYFILKTNISF